MGCCQPMGHLIVSPRIWIFISNIDTCMDLSEASSHTLFICSCWMGGWNVGWRLWEGDWLGLFATVIIAKDFYWFGSILKGVLNRHRWFLGGEWHIKVVSCMNRIHYLSEKWQSANLNFFLYSFTIKGNAQGMTPRNVWTRVRWLYRASLRDSSFS